jgi:hypothetical protein
MSIYDFIMDQLNGAESKRMFDHNLSTMEQAAIKESLVPMYEALASRGKGLEKGFDGATKEDMQFVIASVWNALRASMHRQSITGEVPF